VNLLISGRKINVATEKKKGLCNLLAVRSSAVDFKGWPETSGKA